jgi:CDK-activating kinase assembly factor MAT1
MSRKPSAAGGRATSATTATMTATTNGSPDDICPICKTIRYLNKDMVFLINPECYHPMCSNCVTRIFAGPNQCPYSECNKTLRRKDFRRAFFDDLKVEREVDIRKRVAAVFNKGEDDFDSLDSYNAYLEQVETLAMDLVAGNPTARARAQDQLAAYEAEHRAEIERNRRRGERADELSRSRIHAEQQAARARRAEAMRQDEEERRARVADREADLDSLAAAAAGSAGKVMLKRRGQHTREDLARNESALLRAAGGLTIRGLKEKKKGGADTGPYDPFGGMDLASTRYTERTDWKCDWLEHEARRESSLAGGYSAQNDYYARAMFEAFAGLGVFVADEKETGQGTSAAEVATMGAAMAVGGGKMELD